MLDGSISRRKFLQSTALALGGAAALPLLNAYAAPAPIRAGRAARQTATVDSAFVSGTSSTARQWLVLPALPPLEGRSIVLVQNPGRSRVEVSFRLVASEGSAPSIASSSRVWIPTACTSRGIRSSTRYAGSAPGRPAPCNAKVE